MVVPGQLSQPITLVAHDPLGYYDSGQVGTQRVSRRNGEPLERNRTCYIRVHPYEWAPFQQRSPWTANCYFRTS